MSRTVAKGASCATRIGERRAGNETAGLVAKETLMTTSKETISNTCSSNTCTIARRETNVEAHSNICFIFRRFGLNLT